MKGVIYMAHVTKTRFPDYCVGLAIVKDGLQPLGIRVISSHVSSSYEWSLEDMRGMGHDKDYITCFPNGYEIKELPHLVVDKDIPWDEIISSIEQEGGAE